MPSLRLTPFPPPRWAIMPESDDVVIGKVAEDGDLGAKSLYINKSRGELFFINQNLRFGVFWNTEHFFFQFC